MPIGTNLTLIHPIVRMLKGVMVTNAYVCV